MLQTQRLIVRLSGMPLSIAYTDMGNRYGTPLVYIHGWGCTKQDFADAAKNVRLTRYRLIAFDFPGCGESPYPAGRSFTASDMVAITREVLITLGALPAVLAGHSIGGALVIRYADTFPADTLGIVSVAGNMTASDCFMTRDYASQPKHHQIAHYHEWVQRMKASSNKGYQQYGANLERWTDPSAYYDYAHSIVRESDRGDLLPLFISLSLPKLFMYCEHNPSSIDYVEKLLALSGGQVDIQGIPASEHFPGYENPVYYYQLLDDFMKRLSFSLNNNTFSRANHAF